MHSIEKTHIEPSLGEGRSEFVCKLKEKFPLAKNIVDKTLKFLSPFTQQAILGDIKDFLQHSYHLAALVVKSLDVIVFPVTCLANFLTRKKLNVTKADAFTWFLSLLSLIFIVCVFCFPVLSPIWLIAASLVGFFQNGFLHRWYPKKIEHLDKEIQEQNQLIENLSIKISQIRYKILTSTGKEKNEKTTTCNILSKELQIRLNTLRNLKHKKRKTEDSTPFVRKMNIAFSLALLVAAIFVFAFPVISGGLILLTTVMMCGFAVSQFVFNNLFRQKLDKIAVEFPTLSLDDFKDSTAETMIGLLGENKAIHALQQEQEESHELLRLQYAIEKVVQQPEPCHLMAIMQLWAQLAAKYQPEYLYQKNFVEDFPLAKKLISLFDMTHVTLLPGHIERLGALKSILAENNCYIDKKSILCKNIRYFGIDTKYPNYPD